MDSALTPSIDDDLPYSLDGRYHYAIFAGPDSRTNLSGWIFDSIEDARVALASFGRGAVVAVKPPQDVWQRWRAEGKAHWAANWEVTPAGARLREISNG